MSSIQNCLSNLKLKTDKGAKIFTSYIVAGEYSFDETLLQMQSLAKYCDVIELGMPFANPIADGVVIQAASKRSLDANSTNILDILEIVKKFRSTNKHTAIVLMGYYNTIYKMGEDLFVKQISDAGCDGVIVCDLPIYENTSLAAKCFQNNLCFIQLVTNLTSYDRMLQIASYASGFVYFVSVLGTTGTREPDLNEISPSLVKAKSAFVKLPILLGFGIKTQDMAQKCYSICDGIIIGSHIIELYGKLRLQNTNPQGFVDLAKTLADFENEIKHLAPQS